MEAGLIDKPSILNTRHIDRITIHGIGSFPVECLIAEVVGYECAKADDEGDHGEETEGEHRLSE